MSGSGYTEVLACSHLQYASAGADPAGTALEVSVVAPGLPTAWFVSPIALPCSGKVSL